MRAVGRALGTEPDPVGLLSLLVWLTSVRTVCGVSPPIAGEAPQKKMDRRNFPHKKINNHDVLSLVGKSLLLCTAKMDRKIPQ